MTAGRRFDSESAIRLRFAYLIHGSHGGERFEMSTAIEMLIADSARRLLGRLNEPQAAQDENGIVSQGSLLAPRPKTSAKRILDVSGLQRVESGNFILLSAKKDRLESWAVLVPLEFQRESGFVAFRVRGVIEVALDPHLFVTRSYLYILNRPADADGMATYVAGLANGTLSHAELLFALASSAEARKQYERLLIYPMAAGAVPDEGGEASIVSEFDRCLLAKAAFSEQAD